MKRNLHIASMHPDAQWLQSAHRMDAPASARGCKVSATRTQAAVDAKQTYTTHVLDTVFDKLFLGSTACVCTQNAIVWENSEVIRTNIAMVKDIAKKPPLIETQVSIQQCRPN